MIKLFYTGSRSFNSAQTLASESLGGFISNTTVPNGVVNSLFSPLGLMDFYSSKKISKYIGLGLYLFFFDGELSYDKINLIFNLSYNEENEPELEFFKNCFKYRIGLGPISGDSTNGYYMEKITSNSEPFYMLQDFQELILNEDIKFNNIKLNESGIGIWINRLFDPKKFKEQFGLNSDYWIQNDKIPNFDFIFNLDIKFEGIEDEESSSDSEEESFSDAEEESSSDSEESL